MSERPVQQPPSGEQAGSTSAKPRAASFKKANEALERRRASCSPSPTSELFLLRALRRMHMHIRHLLIVPGLPKSWALFA